MTTHQNCQLLSLLQRSSQPPIFLTVSTSPRTIPSMITVSLGFLLSEFDCCFHSLTYEHRWKSLIIQEHVSIMSVPVPLVGGSRSGACGGVLLTSLRLVVDKTRRLTTATTPLYQHLQTALELFLGTCRSSSVLSSPVPILSQHLQELDEQGMVVGPGKHGGPG